MKRAYINTKTDCIETQDVVFVKAAELTDVIVLGEDEEQMDEEDFEQMVAVDLRCAEKLVSLMRAFVIMKKHMDKAQLKEIFDTSEIDAEEINDAVSLIRVMKAVVNKQLNNCDATAATATIYLSPLPED